MAGQVRPRRPGRRPVCGMLSAPRSIGAVPTLWRLLPNLARTLDGAHQVVGAGAGCAPDRIQQHVRSPGRHPVQGKQLHRTRMPIEQCSARARLHLHGIPRAPPQDSPTTAGCCARQLLGALADLRGSAAVPGHRRAPTGARPWPVLRWSATANVRISSMLSPQTRPERMLVGGRVHIEDAARMPSHRAW